MRKARYDMRKVICKNASCIGSSSNVARPGYWVTWTEANRTFTGRVLGRIAETDRDGANCSGYLAIVRLHSGMQSAGICWVHPDSVSDCWQKPPAALLTWITGDEWVSNKDDIARIVAMSEHGSMQEQFIANRGDPEHAYNSRPAYVQQFILE